MQKKSRLWQGEFNSEAPKTFSRNEKKIPPTPRRRNLKSKETYFECQFSREEYFGDCLIIFVCVHLFIVVPQNEKNMRHHFSIFFLRPFVFDLSRHLRHFYSSLPVLPKPPEPLPAPLRAHTEVLVVWVPPLLVRREQQILDWERLPPSALF